jgi:hypothetical protein
MGKALRAWARFDARLAKILIKFAQKGRTLWCALLQNSEVDDG